MTTEFKTDTECAYLLRGDGRWGRQPFGPILGVVLAGHFVIGHQPIVPRR